MAKCPYCQQGLTIHDTNREEMDARQEVNREVEGVVKKEIMYSCPHCDSVLGFGFFFGGLLTHRP